MTFTAIVTAHAQDPSKILGNLMYQTRKPDEIIVLYSGLDLNDPATKRLFKDFEGVRWIERPNFEDWGHDKRAHGLEKARGDAVGFFNADDSYDLRYVELMMAEIEKGADAVYCSWNTIPNCTFNCCSSTSGNFVVRTGLGRAVGYTQRDYAADGHFIEAVREHATHIHRVDDLLYFHNVQ